MNELIHHSSNGIVVNIISITHSKTTSVPLSTLKDGNRCVGPLT